MARARRKAKRAARKEKRQARRTTRKEKRAAKGGGIIKRTTKKLVSKAKKTLKTVGENAKFGPLLPFKVVMTKALRKKGVTPPKKLPQLAEAFFQVVVKKGSYTPSNYEENTLDPISVSLIVKTIIDFIKGIKKRKEEGQPLSEEDEAILTDSEEVAEEVFEAGLNDTSNQRTAEGEDDDDGFDIGQFFKDYWWAIAAAVVLGIFLFKGKN